MARIVSSRILGQHLRDASGARCRAILRDAKKQVEAVPTCTQADLKQAIEKMGIITGVSYVQFLRGGPAYLVTEILPAFQLKLEGFAHHVSPRGVRVVPKPIAL